nr:MAG TPA: hypothetical protein [Caudoviricetes sp.]
MTGCVVLARLFFLLADRNINRPCTFSVITGVQAFAGLRICYPCTENHKSFEFRICHDFHLAFY